MSVSDVTLERAAPFLYKPRVSSDPNGLVGGASDVSQPASLVRKAERANGSRIKRTVDICGALAGMVLLAPLLLMVAALIKLDSPGPVLFRQERYGRDRRPFWILKFRSMTVLEAQGAFSQASLNDARVTRVGRMLRRMSIDELPQLFNVLKGDMSLVGPRPHAIAMDDVYAEIVPNYGDRHLVRPGLTGLAQVEGYRGPTGEISLITGRLRLDRAYVRRWSALGDIRILLMTPFKLLDRRAF